MPPDLKSQAEALAIGLEIGAVSVAEAVAWADTVLESDAEPHWSVCDVAMMGKRYPPDVVSALREVPGTADVTWVRAEVLRSLLRGLEADHSRADQIASALYLLAPDQSDPDLRSVGWWAWDGLILADARTIEQTRDEVVQEMLRVLRVAVDRLDADLK